MHQTFKLLVLCFLASAVNAQENVNNNKFRQLYGEFATPNVYRTASGAPGSKYYQQQANYTMQISLDDEKQQIHGEETITYINNSPDPLSYLWLQLDQNVRKKDSESQLTETSDINQMKSPWMMNRYINEQSFDGGFKIESVTDIAGNPIPYTIVETMMRIDLSKDLLNGGSYSFKVKWWYNVNDRMKIGGRSGYEYFKEEDNYLYTIAQFFPRMCVYNDVEGWQNKQFLGAGEFTLPFGNYDVQLTVPENHVVAATGELQNGTKILTKEQQERWKKAQSADVPMFIVTPEEALANETTKSSGTKTWHFKANNVRDFAFASSKKFIWDAQVVKQETSNVMAMSYYPKEGNPLWERYSTRVIAQTLKTYSKFTFDYPYPVAISVHSASIGMEYPMICFNGGRPDEDGTYSDRTKYGMQSVIIHEVGHNYFPMIVNSDERQWTWMDEGLNTFLQYLTEQEWERNYPSRRGPANLIVDYMKGDKQYISPIMTNSESIWQFGNNAYGKPATALNILRETIMGRELFDFAFKTYANRWKFKHPTPEDFFRTMEDASGIDLDWFWRGWFFTNDHVDISLKNVSWYQLDSHDPDKEAAFKKDRDGMQYENISIIRNKDEIKQTENERDPSINDEYTNADPYAVTDKDRADYKEFYETLTPEQKEFLDKGHHFYQLDFENIGGLVMPIILEFTFEDDTKELIKIPAEIWRFDDTNISKVFVFEKKVKAIALDPFLETADTETNNNYWPARAIPSKFDLYERRGW